MNKFRNQRHKDMTFYRVYEIFNQFSHHLFRSFCANISLYTNYQGVILIKSWNYF